MKRFFCLTLILGFLCTSSGIAQTTKGSALLGASSQFSFLPFGEGLPVSNLLGIGFSTFTLDDDTNGDSESETKFRSFNFSPKLGYFPMDNLALGVDLSFPSLKITYTYMDEESEEKTSVIGIGPFVRYYFSAGKFLPFVEAGAAFGRIKCVYDSSFFDEEECKTGIRGFHAGGGAGVPLGEKVTLDLWLGYQSMTFNEEDEEETYKETIGTIGLKIGLLVFLGKD